MAAYQAGSLTAARTVRGTALVEGDVVVSTYFGFGLNIPTRARGSMGSCGWTRASGAGIGWDTMLVGVAGGTLAIGVGER